MSQEFWTLKLSDIFNVIGLFLGPIVGILLTIWYQKRYEKRQTKVSLFRTLVAYRLQFPITPEFVAALNQIDIVFHEDENVINSWRRCFDSLTAMSDFETKKLSIVDLLHEMGQALGYVPVRQTVYLQPYAPQQFADDNQRKLDIDAELLKFLQKYNSLDQSLF